MVTRKGLMELAERAHEGRNRIEFPGGPSHLKSHHPIIPQRAQAVARCLLQSVVCHPDGGPPDEAQDEATHTHTPNLEW